MTTMDEEAQGPVKLEIHSRETLCRVCACNTELLIPIFDGEGLENNIPEKLDRYLPIQVTQSDVLPVQICFQCASTVISWHELSTTCIEAEQKLKAMFGSDLEVNTSDDQHSVGIVEQGVESNSSKDAGQERCLQEMKLDGISKKLICQICYLEFSDTSSFGEHCISSHAQILPSFADGKTSQKCHLCPDSFPTEDDKKRHLESKHSLCSEDSPVKLGVGQNCEFCGRYFRHKSILDMHQVSCRKLQEKFYDTDGYCDYETVNESIELGVNAQLKEEECVKGMAKRGGRSSSSFNRKQKSSKRTTKEEIFYGPSDAVTEKRHLQNKDKNEKRVSCAYCIKSFALKCDAISHVRQAHHNKLKEFLTWLERRKLYLKDKLCFICDETFKSAGEVKSHIENCHKELKLACMVCSELFQNESELLMHSANHNTDNNDHISEASGKYISTQDPPNSNSSASAMSAYPVNESLVNIAPDFSEKIAFSDGRKYLEGTTHPPSRSDGFAIVTTGCDIGHTHNTALADYVSSLPGSSNLSLPCDSLGKVVSADSVEKDCDKLLSSNVISQNKILNNLSLPLCVDITAHGGATVTIDAVHVSDPCLPLRKTQNKFFPHTNH